MLISLPLPHWNFFFVKHSKSVVHFIKAHSPFIAGHDLIHLSFNVDYPKTPPKTITCSTLKRIDTEQHKNLISARLPPFPPNQQLITDINLLEHSLTTYIFSFLDHLSPNRSVTIHCPNTNLGFHHTQKTGWKKVKSLINLSTHSPVT